jgi:hypothetical protein
MIKGRPITSQVRWLHVAFVAAAPAFAACAVGAGAPDEPSDQEHEALSACSVAVTTNSYKGAPDYWGTLKFKNTGSDAMTSPTIAFKVPSGVKCDYDPSGWKHTQSGTTCTYTRKSSLTIKPGASYTFEYSTNSDKAFTAGSVHVSDPSCGGSSSSSSSSSSSGSTGSGEKQISDVYITWYGFNDNSCQVESQHNCNTIAFPKSDGFPVVHDIATEGKGTYDDPITFATAAKDSGSPAEFPPGTRIYVPLVHKYFIMEDQCYECGQEWFSKGSYHVDLWMGPSYGSANSPLMSCEDKLTQGDPYHGTGTILVNPSKNHPVDTSPLFHNDSCTAHTYPQP